ncbi:hypothetical protein NHX12_008648 [Muraenolepis orangiensis]|uniref:Alpha-2-macroglobulin-like n=1 Tax=Muraenolepis orangiensis TaxID=630683 RepID=A0A9Q0DLP6_9TELE|nr:hypothetical protein NHX12_008648 [Muraenolepis orangiensis]
METAGVHMWRWLLVACLSWICLGRVAASGPHYMVTIPAVLEAGAESRFCASLLRPNETLHMTVTLRSEEENITLFQSSSQDSFSQCLLFKFDVKVKVPKQLSVAQEEIKAEVCSTYTYKQPVPATASLQICRPLDHYVMIPMRITPEHPEGEPEFEAPCHKETKQAVYFNDTPIPDKLLHLFEGERWSVGQLSQNLTTDSDGVASFSFNTSRFMDDFQLTVSAQPVYQEYQGYRIPHYQDSEHILSLFRPKTEDTPTISSLEVKKRDTKLVCSVEELIDVHFTFVGEVPGPVDIMYLVVVYASLPSENVIAHSADFDTEKCFANQVSLEFSPSAAVPGEQNRLLLRAQPDSLCGISAVDQSVLIKEPGKKLTADKIFDLLPVQRNDRYPYEVNDPDTCLRVRPRRSFLPYPGREDSNAYSVFQGVGLKMFTNLILKSPSCLTYHGREYHFGIHHRVHYGPKGPKGPKAVAMEERMESPRMVGMAGSRNGPPPPPILETVRTFFPETWLWDLVDVGKSGLKEVPVIVPDTITTWETEAFCLSEEGFGLAPPKELVVFQPFFLELSLPYSVIRGENLELKATVFNYQSSCIMVHHPLEVTVILQTFTCPYYKSYLSY